MNRSIQRLMALPAAEHDLAWLQNALQSAVELELATLPPYLCGMYSVKRPSTVFQLINEIVFDEMAHFGLACNM